MRGGLIILLILAVAGCSKIYVRAPGNPSSPHEDEHPDWAYTGEHGPEHWPESYPDCALPGESPINLADARAADLPQLTFSHNAVEGKARDTGHAVQVDTEGGSFQAGDTVYILQQLHFHVPSEHTFDGKRYESVIHMVHLDPDGQIAVVGVPVTTGKENSFLEDVLDEMDQDPEDREEVEIGSLLPDNLSYYRYVGSLTTPPCTGGVDWFVLADPIEASSQQFDRLAAYHSNNVRPLQPLAGRTILRSR